ncbi:hypothetical protein EPI10_032693 [Gossypium australe]|uniref:Uncharacterized protein n=1 Tax=Gossypium australe TaxID=47621 RepID=A0A5B6X499_9ROSI|nr:hypothetical protein EPI10_032693 [Gossypium australe]
MKFVKKQLHLECLLEDLIQLEVSLWTMTTSATWRSTTLLISVKNGNSRLHTKESLSANWFALCPLFVKSPLGVTIVHSFTLFLFCHPYPAV